MRAKVHLSAARDFIEEAIGFQEAQEMRERQEVKHKLSLAVHGQLASVSVCAEDSGLP